MTHTAVDFEINPCIHLTEDEQTLLLFLADVQGALLLGDAVAKFRKEIGLFKRETDVMLTILGRSGFLWVDFGGHDFDNPAYSIRTTADQMAADVITDIGA